MCDWCELEWFRAWRQMSDKWGWWHVSDTGAPLMYRLCRLPPDLTALLPPATTGQPGPQEEARPDDDCRAERKHIGDQERRIATLEKALRVAIAQLERHAHGHKDEPPDESRCAPCGVIRVLRAALSGERPAPPVDAPQRYATCDACGGNLPVTVTRCPSCGDAHKLSYGERPAPTFTRCPSCNTILLHLECTYCAEGYPRNESSIGTGAFVHNGTPVGRVVCERPHVCRGERQTPKEPCACCRPECVKDGCRCERPSGQEGKL